jgi:hypothetical protein
MNQPSHRSHSRNPSHGGHQSSSRFQPRIPSHGGNQASSHSQSRNPVHGGNQAQASSRSQPRAPSHDGNQAQGLSRSQPRNPLHGIRLDTIVEQLVAKHGWAEMGRRIPIRCFLLDPSINSSLTFLRRTPWARKKVEDWYIAESVKK